MEMHRSEPTCPVCKSVINKDKLIPIYGRGTEKKDPRFIFVFFFFHLFLLFFSCFKKFKFLYKKKIIYLSNNQTKIILKKIFKLIINN